VTPGRAATSGSAAPAGDGTTSPGSGEVGVRRTLERLLEETGCPHALLFSARGVVEVGRGGMPPPAPDAETGRQLAGLTRATDLGTPAAREALAAPPTRWAAALALPGPDAGVLLLAPGPLDTAGSVRPRTLAALDATAQQLSLQSPTAAWERLAGIDDEVQRLDRLAALGGLVAEIVHEIRNPLVSVKTFLQLLPEQWSEPDFRGEFLEVATDELRRVERLLDVVLEHARPQRADAASPGAAIDAAIESVVQLVAHRATERSVRLVVEIDEGLGALALSGDRLRQVLLNLTLNAIAVTPDSGAVTLRARGGATGVELEIEDEGPGVPEALREQIFEPFFSTRSEKAGGLGLAISRRIAQEAGGSLHVEPRANGGSRFRAVLPYA